MLSDRAKEVRFAGELWYDEENCFRLNNSSGTYRPADKMIKQCVELFDHLAPKLAFQGISRLITTQPSIKRQIVQKAKQKLTLSHDTYVI